MDNPMIVTGLVRFSYLNVFEKKDDKYSACLLIPKEDTETLDKIKAAVKTAQTNGKSIWGGRIPKSLKLPLRDGDEEREDDEAFENMFFLNAANYKRQPGIVDRKREDILDAEELVSGDWGRAAIRFYAFNGDKQKGVACALEHIQKIKTGEPLAGSGGNAQDAFDDDFDGDDDGMLG